MFKRLDDVEIHYNELTDQLAQPDIIAKTSLYQQLAKERADLTELMDTYRSYKQIAQQINDNHSIINDEEDEELRNIAKEELPELQTACDDLTKQLKILLLPKDPNDDKNILLEIRAGTGGDEAALFAADLFRMYKFFAEQKNWKVEILSSNSTGLGGIKELIAQITGQNVYSSLKYESGVHRVQRVPDTETSGRVHTSACTVAVMPEAEDIDLKIDEQDLRIDIYRASGPGGQGVNTTDSAVRITHIPTGAVVACQDERSQHKNKARAMKILKTRILDIKIREQHQERSDARRSMIGSGDRSEKIRTYNFPQNRLTDHRIGLTVHNLLQVLDGKLEDILVQIRTSFQMEMLKSQ